MVGRRGGRPGIMGTHRLLKGLSRNVQDERTPYVGKTVSRTPGRSCLLSSQLTKVELCTSCLPRSRGHGGCRRERELGVALG